MTKPAQQRFHLMAKPASYKCNLKCDYCFYLEKETYYGDSKSKMDEQALEQYVASYIAAQPDDIVHFAWQGGEPMMAGLAFFRRAVELQCQYANGKTITNSFQTNGVGIDDEWARFFAEHRFLIGISIDGDAPLHDAYRISVNGKPTFERVKSAIGFLKKYRVEFNTMTVVNDKNWQHGKATYQLLKSLGSQHMQFIPIVEAETEPSQLHSLQGTPAIQPFSVPREGYGQFMVEVFDEWRKQDVGQIHIQLLESVLATWLGYSPGLCIFSENCGNALVAEANGDIYSCDHFVYPEYKLGNLDELELAVMVDSPQQRDFGLAKSETLPSTCLSCEFRPLCHGGCPKQRIVDAGEVYRHNYLCPSYKKLFTHTADFMKNTAQQIRQQMHQGRG